MKVLFLQNVLFPYRLPFYNGLVRRGLDVTVVHSGAPVAEDECMFTQSVLPVKKLAGFYWQSNRPSHSDFDVIVAMFDLHWPQNILCTLGHRDYRLVFWGHGFGNNALGNKLRRVLANRADAFVLYTEPGRKRVVEGGVRQALTYVANNTVEVANHEGKSAPGTSFLYVGRLQKRKRVDLALRAFANLIKQTSNKTLTFDIVGDGDIKSELSELSVSLGIEDKVIFHGAITDNQLLKPLFHNSLAYVSPGHLGLGLNHAMAFGVPILSVANRPHAPEIAVLNNRNSLLFRANNDQDVIEKLTENMKKLVEDSELAMAFSQRCYQDYVDCCSMEKMLDGFEAAIRGSRQEPS